VNFVHLIWYQSFVADLGHWLIWLLANLHFSQNFSLIWSLTVIRPLATILLVIFLGSKIVSLFFHHTNLAEFLILRFLAIYKLEISKVFLKERITPLQFIRVSLFSGL
jgi:hypothetical protein